MPTIPPFPAASEQRLLAAIVFTDVAGFSRRVQAAESTTLKLLERDFVTMRAFAAMHSGRVVKSTGDGLLLFFNSAVQAVEWALKTQRHFADQAAELPAAEVLKHRVGVHLGDVIVANGDVMGDGVNIAARVQAEAPAGGICISQMVYGVVKNKLELDVLLLDQRQLKNISEVIRIYRVLLEPPTHKVAAVEPRPQAREVALPRKNAAGWKKGVGIAAAAVGLGAAGVLLFRAHLAHRQELAGSEDIRAALGAAVKADAPAAPRPTPEAEGAGPVATRTEADAARGAVAAVAGAAPASAPFDFAALAAGRPPGAPVTDEDRRALQAATESLAGLEAWTVATLQRYTRENPLYVRPLRSPGFQSSTLFTDASQQICFAEGGAIRRFKWEELPVDRRGAIVTSLLRSSPVPPAREVVRGAEAFALVHRLPEMAEMLLRERK